MSELQKIKSKEVIMGVKSIVYSNDIQKRLSDMLDTRASAFTSSIINLVASNKDLQLCSSDTILKSAMVAASLNLSIDPNLGQAAIVPYNSKNSDTKVAQFQMMWRGFVQLAIRSGVYERLNATKVYADEVERYDPFTARLVTTPPDKWNQRRAGEDDKVVGYYAYFKLNERGGNFEMSIYMTKEDVENHAKKYSQAYRSDKKYKSSKSIWTTDFDTMGEKTVLKRLLSRYGVLSVDMEKAIAYDQAVIKSEGADEVEFEYIDNTQEENFGKLDNPFKEVEQTDINDIFPESE